MAFRQVKPSNRLNWVGYAIAEHLCQSYEFAWTCIDNYENSFKELKAFLDPEIVENLAQKLRFIGVSWPFWLLGARQEQDQVSDYENSELHLYKASIMEEAGKFEEALECLTQNEAQIVDKRLALLPRALNFPCAPPGTTLIHVTSPS